MEVWYLEIDSKMFLMESIDFYFSNAIVKSFMKPRRESRITTN